jgi:hypothetical protein
MLILVVLFYIVIGYLEFSVLYKQNKKQEMVLYSVVFFSAFLLSMLLMLGVKIPSPAKPIEDAVKAFKDMIQ